MRFFVALLLAWLPLCTAGFAQSSQTALLADKITYDARTDKLIATGNVEVVFEGRVLRAQEIRFSNDTGDVVAIGPLQLSEPGQPTINADRIELDSELRRGLVQGARLVLAENFQIAATEARLLENGQSALYKTVASACIVCDDDQVPLWLIRAERVVRDDETKQIHFSNVRFEAFGATVAYLPYFRIPDPSVKRASGFLDPDFSRSDYYGYGLKTPYFIVIAEDRDVTITPFLTSRAGLLLEAEYRQAFAAGDMTIGGAFAISEGRVGESDFRGYAYAAADFALPRGFDLQFRSQSTSRKGFLRQFGYSGADRLRSQATISRQSGNEYLTTSLVGYQTLRDGELNSTIPNVLPHLSYRRYWDEQQTGGRISLDAEATLLSRASGRDVLELGTTTAWEKEIALGNGILSKTTLGGSAQAYVISDDAAYPDEPQLVFASLAATELRWPWVRTRNNSIEVLEPVLQAVYSQRAGDFGTVPNEDSPTLEFDAANLFALNRFPGNDLIEDGLRFNLGAEYTRIDPSGWSVSLALGQVFRAETSDDFPQNTGLNDRRSNIVASTTLDFPPYLQISNQSLFDNGLNFSRNDVQAGLRLDDLTLDASYVFLAEDPIASTQEQHEILLSSKYRFADHWALDATMRRNLATGENVTAIGGLEYGNECVRARFSVSRRFTNSSTLPPGTDYGLTVRLAGFGGGTIQFPAQSCVRYSK